MPIVYIQQVLATPTGSSGFRLSHCVKPFTTIVYLRPYIKFATGFMKRIYEIVNQIVNDVANIRYDRIANF